MNEPKKKNRALLFVGIGCLGLITLCCCTGGGVVMWRSSAIGDGATAHAELFLGYVQTGNYDAAFGSSEYLGDTSLYSPLQFQMCLQSTPLGDMTSFTCHSAEPDLQSGDADVSCTIQSATQGPQEVTIHVNSATELSAYLGFIWFSQGAVFGEAWPGDECARWSGREYFGDTPPGRIRPGPPGYGY